VLAGVRAEQGDEQGGELRQPAAVAGIDPRLLVERTEHRLKLMLAELAKLGPEQVDAQERLEVYGIDSLLIMQLNHRLAGVFGELSKTLFFEYPTLANVAAYLAAEHEAACRRWTALEEQEEQGTRAAVVAARGAARPERVRPARRRMADRSQGSGHAREPIAIVGISGRYPGADNLEAYWENLKSGKDCIGELGGDRWPLEGFYDPSADDAVARGRSYSKWGGQLAGFAEFDPLFFNIAPRDARRSGCSSRAAGMRWRTAAIRASGCGSGIRAVWGCSPGSPKRDLRCMVRSCGAVAGMPRRTPRSGRLRTVCRIC
jgi:polyketide synthase PksN